MVLDYPTDPQARAIDDQYMMGNSLLVAPVFQGQTERTVFLPDDLWHDFWTGEAVVRGQTLTVQTPLDHMPVYVRGNALIPLAVLSLSTADPSARELVVQVYGDGSEAAALIEDDGTTTAYQQGAQNKVTLFWDNHSQQGHLERAGDWSGSQYTVTKWQPLSPKITDKITETHTTESSTQ